MRNGSATLGVELSGKTDDCSG